MKWAIFNLALLVSCSTGVHVIAPLVQPDYISPQATGYIYRSDNGGPMTLIQLGSHYQQPQQFVQQQQQFAQHPQQFGQHPLIGNPLGGQLLTHVDPLINTAPQVYKLPQAPPPLPYVGAQPIIVEDAGLDAAEVYDDGLLNHGLLHHPHGHAYEKGGGADYGEEHHAAKGEKGSKGYNTKGHHAKAASGHYGKGEDEHYYKEKGAEANGGHDEAQTHGTQYSSGKSYQGGDHGHKKHFSKGEDIEGYHKVFNKDEFKKDHDFYDTADNSGHFNKHGYEKGHHGSEEAAHKEGGNHDSGHDEAEGGKVGHHSKGETSESDLGHSDEEGEDSHYVKEEEYGKKSGGEAGKVIAYADADDDDDYDY